MAYIVHALRGAHAAQRRAPLSPLLLVQPALARIVAAIARKHPALFERLGPHRAARFVIDPTDLPFALYLEPNPSRPRLRAFARSATPPHDARIAGRFAQLLRMIDSREDGDAMFFSRNLDVSGDTEAVVSLRNALDNLDTPLSEAAASVYGPPGRAALAVARRVLQRRP